MQKKAEEVARGGGERSPPEEGAISQSEESTTCINAK